jgi:hypothetical protein
MAMRRYGRKSAAVSGAGHNQTPPETKPDGVPLGTEPPSSPAADPQAPRQEYGKSEPQADAPEHFKTGLGEQLRQQRAQQQSDQLDLYIHHHFPGALPGERAALRAEQYRHLLAYPPLAHHYAGVAVERGIPRNNGCIHVGNQQ